MRQALPGGPGWIAAKRALDVAAAGLALLVIAPLLGLAAAAIWLESGSPILFRQQRAGLGGAPFEVLKLRTLLVNDRPPEEVGQVTSQHGLLTRTGSVLRRLKIDELPQLWNVLVGDMSLVGPRPTLLSQAAQYTAFQRRRLDVRPGLSGWAQVNGNVSLSWEERILLDVWYIDHWSFRLDLSILLRTLAVVALGEHRNGGALEEARTHAKRVDRGG